MELRCKPGGLALIIKSTAGNEGKVVQCIRIIPAESVYYDPTPGPVWEIDTQIVTNIGMSVAAYYDQWMVPINDPNITLDEEAITTLKKSVDALKS